MSDNKQINIILSKADRTEYGVIKQGENYIFTASFIVKDSIVLVIKNADGFYFESDIKDFKVAGNVYSVCVSGLNISEFEYYYICDGLIKCDPYRKCHAINRDFGVSASQDDLSMSVFSAEMYNFEEDIRPAIPQTEVISYQLHVRGFTKHNSSKVKGKGCFLGIIEKIPYFKELNINQIEIMPAYDFYEFKIREKISEKIPNSISDKSSELKKDINSGYINDLLVAPIKGSLFDNESADKINYWGYKEANYFCPKYEYSYSKDAVTEFKDMVKALHKAGIELIMQMYYPYTVKTAVIIESLKFWYKEYHVDGFHIMGERIPIELILSDDLLYDAKLFFNNLNRDDSVINELCEGRNVIDVNDGFMTAMRRFLKSDGDSLQGFAFSNRSNSDVYKSVNYLTKYEGFTLNDLVSFEHKHNEANGENNTDGNDYNLSWNCGIEGKSSKKTVKELRIRQIKNALCLLLLSQGTPMLFMGDEFMNSQDGNNNPYCQDNEISYLNWKLNKSSEEILSFTKMLTDYRVKHKVLHQNSELKNMDYLQTGSPDISYHQDMAWKSNMNNYLLHIGIMLDGNYAKIPNDNGDFVSDDTLYIAYNMHWENHMFGLPRLKKGRKWEYVFSTCTSDEIKDFCNDLNNTQDEICVYKRSITILKSVNKEEK